MSGFLLQKLFLIGAVPALASAVICTVAFLAVAFFGAALASAVTFGFGNFLLLSANGAEDTFIVDFTSACGAYNGVAKLSRFSPEIVYFHDDTVSFKYLSGNCLGVVNAVSFCRVEQIADLLINGVELCFRRLDVDVNPCDGGDIRCLFDHLIGNLGRTALQFFKKCHSDNHPFLIEFITNILHFIYKKINEFL